MYTYIYIYVAKPDAEVVLMCVWVVLNVFAATALTQCPASIAYRTSICYTCMYVYIYMYIYIYICSITIDICVYNIIQ